MSDLTDFVQEQQESNELRAALRRSQAALVKEKARNLELAEEVYRAAKDAAIAIGKPEPVTKLATDRRRGREEVALIHLTDWQLGKRTESYNTEVCIERVMDCASRVRKINAVQRHDHPVRRAVVLFGGDMVEGVNIFPGQPFEIDSTLYTQLFACTNLMQRLIRELLADVETVEVWGEYGNHGRLGRKKGGEYPASDNIDSIAYQIAADALKPEKRVVWHPRGSWHQIVTVGAYRAMLIHGDEVQGFGGQTPAYGLLRKGNAWASGVVEPFQDIFFGHYHTHLELSLSNGGMMYGTGSPESDNLYAQEFVAAKGKPSQRLHYINAATGITTAQYRLYLG